MGYYKIDIVKPFPFRLWRGVYGVSWAVAFKRPVIRIGVSGTLTTNQCHTLGVCRSRSPVHD